MVEFQVLWDKAGDRLLDASTKAAAHWANSQGSLAPGIITPFMQDPGLAKSPSSFWKVAGPGTRVCRSGAGLPGSNSSPDTC